MHINADSFAAVSFVPVAFLDRLSDHFFSFPRGYELPYVTRRYVYERVYFKCSAVSPYGPVAFYVRYPRCMSGLDDAVLNNSLHCLASSHGLTGSSVLVSDSKDFANVLSTADIW